MMLVNGTDALAAGQSSKANCKIDFHSHAILPSYINGLNELKIDAATEEGFPLPKWSVEAHLKFMSDAEINYSILSMSTPHISNSKVIRRINEEFSALCQKYPDKFGFVAALPLPDIEGSLAEIDYSTKKLNALGFKLASNSDGVYLGDERIDPLFAELNRRKSLIKGL